jgi:hypothetical protein
MPDQPEQLNDEATFILKPAEEWKVLEPPRAGYFLEETLARALFATSDDVQAIATRIGEPLERVLPRAWEIETALRERYLAAARAVFAAPSAVADFVQQPVAQPIHITVSIDLENEPDHADVNLVPWQRELGSAVQKMQAAQFAAVFVTSKCSEAVDILEIPPTTPMIENSAAAQKVLFAPMYEGLFGQRDLPR